MLSPRPERETQNRVVRLFTDPTDPHYLGYRDLGDWQRRPNNRPIDTDLLTANLTTRGYTPTQISAALAKLEAAADPTGTTLYQANLRTYSYLRYGIEVKTTLTAPYETIHLIDWANPAANDFALAQEVTLKNGGHERRPDIVLYLNGLAICVIELKRSSVSVGEAINQLITNQEDIFNPYFFTTSQLLIAGTDTDGLHYGTTRTLAKFYVKWKLQNPPAAPDTTPGALLDRPLAELCNKTRLLDLIRNFVIFDGGQKKVPRPHQYQGAKLAQARIQQQAGGVIWHTQGSGKSILMVLLTQWLLQHDPNGRILIITDRDELDKQIERVLQNAGIIGETEPAPRITSRADFITKLTAANPRVLCALIHKFDLNLTGYPPAIQGRFYVFVDECHRTQGGDLNKAMKRWLPDAIFIGFTGTPLLKDDKNATREVFGTNIHTYKFYEAVADRVILDLKYEARSVPQRLTSPTQIDDWFTQQTRGLTPYQTAIVRKRWATMEKLMSAGDRKQRIAANIIHDFSTVSRLASDRGTALLVVASIYDACHYYRILDDTLLGPYCGIITSYQPNHNAISREPPGSDERYKFDTYTRRVLAPGQSTKAYEDEAKRQFIEEPVNQKLLIVVSKLLTGFDAPSCTYIYLDNSMKDHTLFQAICRTNRLDGDDKDYGYIVDYKELFQQVQDSIAVYNSEELETIESGADSNIIIKDAFTEGRANLEVTREALSYLCEPVPPPKQIENYLSYFCGEVTTPDNLAITEPLRITFYKAVATFLRAYVALAKRLNEAYSSSEIATIIQETRSYTDIRNAIKTHAAEELDTKPFEAGMRHLINSYIQADAATAIGNLSEMSLTEAIIETGIHDAIAQKLNQKGNLSRRAIAEGVINNVRKTIVRDQLTDPKFYAEMSRLLDDLIAQKRDDTDDYEQFLRDAEALVRQLSRQEPTANVPTVLHGKNEAIVLFNNLDSIATTTFQAPADNDARAVIALALDRAMKEQAPADWKGDKAREEQVQNAIFPIMDSDGTATMSIFDIIKNQGGYS